MAFLGIGGDSLPSYNVAPLQTANNQSAKKQGEIATGLTTDLSKLNQPFQDSTHQTGVDYQNESRASANNFLNDIGSASDKLGENLSNTLYRRTMAQQPQQQASLRESLAATGGLQRGGADQAFVNQAAQTASGLAEGNSNIVNQQLATREDAIKQAQSVDQGLIQERLGVDQNTLAKIYASGRQDLIDEANSLLGIESNRNQTDLGLQTTGMNAQLAQANGVANRDAGLTSALLGAAGTAAGAAYGGPVGGALGNSLVKKLVTSRGNVDDASVGNA